VTAEASGRARNIRVNGEEVAWREGDVVALLARSGIDPARPGIAVAVNGRVVPRADWSASAVRPGDEIEIVGAVAGG
jgi:sulfur carrier protein